MQIVGPKGTEVKRITDLKKPREKISLPIPPEVDADGGVEVRVGIGDDGGHRAPGGHPGDVDASGRDVVLPDNLTRDPGDDGRCTPPADAVWRPEARPVPTLRGTQWPCALCVVTGTGEVRDQIQGHPRTTDAHMHVHVPRACSDVDRI